ncbi:MAG: hypothetical protein A3G18_01070 [Rhodospirillales bacterium RIFCSPLOWO2_12_FULL_58_28]|nr:MAG: hypothetical protein A3H92_04270 [Rhodospirillales bacterium RIFCSPLOWO2_02_FULL_58_16]OHC77995.1 MAG: hypothetical protein A3G18_01070 [Rhodospirillales bacterium RIFCSPLOWO2_12_FULL_58_28]
MKKWIGIAVKFLVSGTLIWFLLGRINLDAAMTRLVEVDRTMLALATVIFLLQLVICVFRWMAVMDAIKAPLKFITALRIYYIGAFFSQTLPSSVGGDAVRIYRTYRVGMTLGNAVNGVMLERAATVLALLIVVVATQPFFLPRVSVETASWAVSGIALLSAGAGAGMAALMMLDRLPSSLRRWRLVRGLATLAADTRTVFLNPLHLFKVISWSATGHLNLTLGVYLMAVGLSLEISWLDCIALIPPVILITILPISIAGWGVREGAMVYAFSLIGVPEEGALVLSLLFGLVSIVTSLPGGVVWLTGGGMNADPIPKNFTANS